MDSDGSLQSCLSNEASSSTWRLPVYNCEVTMAVGHPAEVTEGHQTFLNRYTDV